MDLLQSYKNSAIPLIFLLCLAYITGDEVGEVYGKQRKYYHAGNGKHHCDYFSGDCHRVDIAPYGSHIHRRPPQGCPIRIDLWIYSRFALIEYERAEVRNQYHYNDIRHQQARYGIARKITHYYAHGQRTTCQRYEPDEIHGIVCELQVELVDYVEIRY